MKTDPNNPDMWEYQDKCVHPDCKDGCKLGLGGDTPHPRIQQELREVLKRAYYNGLDRKGWSLYEEQQALEAINSLVRECIGEHEVCVACRDNTSFSHQSPHYIGSCPADDANEQRQQFLNRWMGEK